MYRTDIAASVSAIAFAAFVGGCASSQPIVPGPPWPPPPLQTSASETIAPSSSPTIVALPAITAFGGTMLLPAGSGSATLTLSLAPPNGVPAVTSLTPVPPPGPLYVSLTAQNTLSLASLPGFNLDPTPDTGIVNFLNQWNGNSWSNTQIGWDATSPPTVCFSMQGPAVSLQNGASLFMAVSVDEVLPLPTTAPGTSLPPCPQTTP